MFSNCLNLAFSAKIRSKIAAAICVERDGEIAFRIFIMEFKLRAAKCVE